MGNAPRLTRRRVLAGAAAAAGLVVASQLAPRLGLGPWGGTGGPDREPIALPGFVVGANYEGPADRAWAMWEEARFDAALIGADFGRARDVGLDALRVFVQAPLARQVQAGDWSRLDRVVDLGDQHELRLILTLADYPEPSLKRRVEVAEAISRRYRDHPAVLAYDLENEPRAGDLITTEYPDEPVLPQTDALIRAYGEAIPRDSALAWRAQQPSWLPGWISDDQAYRIINSLLIVDIFQDEARKWMVPRSGATVLDFLAEPYVTERWSALVGALNSAQARWINSQAEAIRRADAARPITIGYNDLLLATLPANRALDYLSFHHYLAPDDTAPVYTVEVASQIAERVGRPVVLGEFGWSTHEVEPARAAELEAATLEEAHRGGLSGGLKWMLNDAVNQPDPREASFGLFRADGSPKPSAMAVQELNLA